MRSKKKIRLMIKLASLEQHKGRELNDARCYYRSDYISIRMMKNALQITAAYIIGFFLWACYNMDAVMAKLNTLDIWGMVTGIFVTYAVFLAIGLLLTYMTATRSYFRGQKELQKYRLMLEKLSEESEESRY